MMALFIFIFACGFFTSWLFTELATGHDAPLLIIFAYLPTVYIAYIY